MKHIKKASQKSAGLIIPIAAFALAATNAQAFNPQLLSDIGLSDEQIAAFEVARELKEDGDRDGARNILAEAGIDLDIVEEVREVISRGA